MTNFCRVKIGLQWGKSMCCKISLSFSLTSSGMYLPVHVHSPSIATCFIGLYIEIRQQLARDDKLNVQVFQRNDHQVNKVLLPFTLTCDTTLIGATCCWLYHSILCWKPKHYLHWVYTYLFLPQNFVEHALRYPPHQCHIYHMPKQCLSLPKFRFLLRPSKLQFKRKTGESFNDLHIVSTHRIWAFYYWHHIIPKSMCMF